MPSHHTRLPHLILRPFCTACRQDLMLTAAGSTHTCCHSPRRLPFTLTLTALQGYVWHLCCANSPTALRCCSTEQPHPAHADWRCRHRPAQRSTGHSLACNRSCRHQICRGLTTWHKIAHPVSTAYIKCSHHHHNTQVNSEPCRLKQAHSRPILYVSSTFSERQFHYYKNTSMQAGCALGLQGSCSVTATHAWNGLPH
jgi:hypothetical protein